MILKLGQFPNYICYDNSCQLHKFCTNRVKTEKSSFLDNEIFIIDRLHVQGHVEQCKSVYHPNKYNEINSCNTMICEQRNFWIGGFKHMTKHMNQYRFAFFLFIHFNYYNEIKTQGYHLINYNNIVMIMILFDVVY